MSELTALVELATTLGKAIPPIAKMLGKSSPNSPGSQLLEVGVQLGQIQTHVLALQQEYASKAQQILDLKQRVAQFEDWEGEAAKYELHQLGERDARVYRLRQERVQGGETAHDICTTCYEDRKKSILQPHPQGLTCHRCKATYQTPPEPLTPEERLPPGEWGDERDGYGG